MARITKVARTSMWVRWKFSVSEHDAHKVFKLCEELGLKPHPHGYVWSQNGGPRTLWLKFALDVPMEDSHEVAQELMDLGAGHSGGRTVHLLERIPEEERSEQS